MDFIDIINQFHLKLNNAFSNVNDQVRHHFDNLEKELPLAYDEIKVILNEINEKNKLYNESILKELTFNENLINSSLNEFNKINANAINTLDKEVQNLSDALKRKEKEIKELNQQIDSKRYLEQIKSRDILNVRDIDKNLANNALLKKIPSFYKKYNERMVIFTKVRDQNNNYLHASTSKQLYTYTEANHSLKEHLKEDIEKINQEIHQINLEIEAKKTEFDNLKFTQTVHYNDQIKKLNEEFNLKLEKFNVHHNLDIELFNKRRDISINEFEVKRLEILNEKEKQLEIINKKKEKNKEIYLETLNRIKTTGELSLFKEEQNLNRILEQNYIKEDSASHSLKRKMNKENKTQYYSYLHKKKEYYRQLAQNESTYLKQKERIKTDEILLNLRINKELEKITIFQKANQFRFDLEMKRLNLKNENNKMRINNNHTVNIDKIKNKFEASKLELDKAYKTYEFKRKIELEELSTKLLNAQSDLNYASELENLVKDKDLKEEKLLTNQNDVMCLLNIEKNKYLSKFNVDLIEHKVVMNNLNYEYFRRNEELELLKRNDEYNEDIAFNNESLKNMHEKTDLEIQLRRLNFRHIIEMGRFKRDELLNKNKHELHFNKLKFDINYLTFLTQHYFTIFKIYKTIFKTTLKNITSFIKSNLTNSELIMKEVKKINDIFITFYEDLINNYLQEINKVIDGRIHFELGSKYSMLINEIKKNFDEQKKALTNRKISFERTVQNYRNTIRASYQNLQELNVRKKEATISDDNEVYQIISEIKRYKNLIKKNFKSISYLEKRLKHYPKLIKLIDNEYKHQLNKTMHKKENESSTSVDTLEYFAKTKSIAFENIEQARSSFDFNHVVIYKNLIKNLKFYDYVFETRSTELYKAYLNQLKKYFTKENQNLIKIKQRYQNNFKIKYFSMDNAYKKDLAVLTGNLSENKENLETLIKNNVLNKNLIHEALTKDKKTSHLTYEETLTNQNNYHKRLKYRFDLTICALEDNINQIMKKTHLEIQKNLNHYNNSQNMLRLKETTLKANGKRESDNNIANMLHNIHIMPTLLKNEIKDLNEKFSTNAKNLKKKNKELKDAIHQQERNDFFESSIKLNDAKKLARIVEKNYDNERRIIVKRYQKTTMQIDKITQKQYEI